MDRFPEPTAEAAPEWPVERIRARHSGPDLGHVEPVHDALVAARLDALQVRWPRQSTMGADSDDVAGARSRRTSRRAIRHRLGRAIAGFGHFIEGTPECPDSAAPSAVA